MIDIVKLANGNVAIYDNSTTDFISMLSPDIVEIECNVNGTVKVIQDNGNVEYFDPAMVANTQVLPAAAIPFSGSCADLALILSTDFFFVVSGGGVSDLATVLAAGNSAGANDIDMNGNDLLNVGLINGVAFPSALNDLSDVTISSIANGNFLEYNGTVWVNQGLVYTIELIAALTVDFYAPYNMKINSVTNILNSPTTTIQDDNVAYVLGATIAAGSKITVTVNTAAVVNLNITKA